MEAPNGRSPGTSASAVRALLDDIASSAERLASAARALGELLDESEAPDREPATNSAHDLLTIEEVAERLRIGRTTAYKLLRNGALPSLDLGARVRRVRASDVLAYLRGRLSCGDA